MVNPLFQREGYRTLQVSRWKRDVTYRYGFIEKLTEDEAGKRGQDSVKRTISVIYGGKYD
jgi:hypothetical protein